VSDNWAEAWRPVIDAIGQDVGHSVAVLPDAIEAVTVRRYLEPLEFDCALHCDVEAARAHGHPGVTAPYTSALSFALPAMWRPGQGPLFTSDDRDAQPERTPVRPVFPPFFPPFSGYFATDIELNFMRPALVGETVIRRGTKLLACEPKETRVGRGAFIKTMTEVVTLTGELIATVQSGLYLYQPHSQVTT
jgi:hypothetical protein